MNIQELAPVAHPVCGMCGGRHIEVRRYTELTWNPMIGDWTERPEREEHYFCNHETGDCYVRWVSAEDYALAESTAEI